MRVTVFGAASALGRHVVEDLVFRGHEVVAHADASAPVPGGWPGEVAVVPGSPADPAVVEAAVAGSEAVISVLGPDRTGVPAHASLAECTRQILRAMERHGVRRYVGLGSCRSLGPQERLSLLERAPLHLALLAHPRGHREMAGAVEAVTSSGLDWTLVRCLLVHGGQPRGLKRVGLFGRDEVGPCATRADVARFLAGQILERRYIGAAPAVSG
ncbi:NAD(P)H-binding protein [Kocuria rhizosphaerae]|uniref:NAD(P)-dependent oxidoreductase n=1 Tax=Kocuria rhizosphaerae TaxID=3376285 RepID=UPI0037BEEF21